VIAPILDTRPRGAAMRCRRMPTKPTTRIDRADFIFGCAPLSRACDGELADDRADLLRRVTLPMTSARACRPRSDRTEIARFKSVGAGSTFTAVAAAAAMLRLDQRQVRHAFSYAGQQASGIGYWTRDHEHVEKAFDFAGMGARNA